MPNRDQSYLKAELDGLRDHVDIRFRGMESGMERISLSLEKLVENMTKTAVLETRVGVLESEAEDIRKRQTNHAEQLASHHGWIQKGIMIGAVSAIVAPILLTYFVNNYTIVPTQPERVIYDELHPERSERDGADPVGRSAERD